MGGRKKADIEVEDMSTVKEQIKEYRAMLDEMSKKIIHLDASQKCLAELEGSPNPDSNFSVQPLSSAPTIRCERVQEEKSMVKEMKNEYSKLHNKLNKELERKKKLEKNAENDEIRIQTLEKQLSEKEELISQLSKSLRASQD